MNYFMGQGKLYVAEWSVSGGQSGFRFIGNCTRFDVMPGTGAARYANPGALRKAGDMPRFDIDVESLDAANLAVLLYGAKTEEAGGTATLSTRVYRNSVVVLPHIGITSVTVGNTARPPAPYPDAYFVVDLASGTVALANVAPLDDGTAVSITYTYGAQTTVAAHTQKPSFYALRFSGINTADRSPVAVDVFKTKFDPVDSLPLIGDNFASLKLSGRMHYDSSVAGSRAAEHFFRIRQT